MLKITSLTAAAFALAACATSEAPTASQADRDCFFGSQINGYNTIDDHHVRVTVSPTRNYILTTHWNARDLDWTQHIAIRSSTDTICTGNGLGVEIIGGSPRRNYPVSSIEREPAPAPVQGS